MFLLGLELCSFDFTLLYFSSFCVSHVLDLSPWTTGRKMYHLPFRILYYRVQLLHKKDDIQYLLLGSVVIPDSPITDDSL